MGKLRMGKLGIGPKDEARLAIFQLHQLIDV